MDNQSLAIVQMIHCSTFRLQVPIGAALGLGFECKQHSTMIPQVHHTRIVYDVCRRPNPHVLDRMGCYLSAQKVSLDSQNVALLGWDLEAMLSDGGILLLSPFLQWDLEWG